MTSSFERAGGITENGDDDAFHDSLIMTTPQKKILTPCIRCSVAICKPKKKNKSKLFTGKVNNSAITAG